MTDLPEVTSVALASQEKGTFLVRVTPVVLTLNEEANIGRCLASLLWAERVIIIDSGSSDRTREVATSFTNTEVHSREFDSFAGQWNFGISLVATDWVLALDADYILPPPFVEELRALRPELGLGCYSAGFDYCVFGKPLRSSLYPRRPVLFERSGARFVMDGHRQKLATPHSSALLSNRLRHDDRKSMRCWMQNQVSYAQAESEKLTCSKYSELSLADRLRKTKVLGPPAVAFYCLIVKGLFLDGWRGLYYSGERVAAELMLSLQVIRTTFGQE